MRYKHGSCERCLPLGESGEYDLYYCTEGGIWGRPLLVLRYGDKESEYKCGFRLTDPHYYAAYKLAVEKGYISSDGEDTAFAVDRLGGKHFERLYLKNMWEVVCQVDDDGHLTVVIRNEDGSQVVPMDVDISVTDEEWSERFTTHQIEEDYRKELEASEAYPDTAGED